MKISFKSHLIIFISQPSVLHLYIPFIAVLISLVITYVLLYLFICLLRALSSVPRRSTDSTKSWQNIQKATAGERAVTAFISLYVHFTTVTQFGSLELYSEFQLYPPEVEAV